MAAHKQNSDTSMRGNQTGKWKSSKAGKNWQLRFFRILIRYGGRRPAYHIMYIVVLFYTLFSSSIRASVKPYLARRFPKRQTLPWRFIDSYRLIISFGRCLIDQAAVAILGPDNLEAEFRGKELALRTITSDKGAILINAHAGLWQIAVSQMGFLKKNVSVVMIPPEEDSPIAETLARHAACKFIDPRCGFDSVLQMLQSLKNGEILGLMGDRVFGDEEKTVETEFLGDRITLPYSPYKLAGAANVPILVIMSAKTGYKKYRIELMKVIRVDPADARKPETCAQYAREYARELEKFVDRHPWQFFNFYNLWREETLRENT